MTILANDTHSAASRMSLQAKHPRSDTRGAMDDDVEIIVSQGPPSGKRKSFGPNRQEEALPKRARVAKNVRNTLSSTSRSFPDASRQLPAELWHRVFTFLPPRTLGVLLLVNKLFHNYLDPCSSVKTTHPVFTIGPRLPTLKPNAIWQASRRRFWPRMPSPLKRRSEIEMWRLVCSRTCEFCGQQSQGETDPSLSSWCRGPGEKDVSPVFPFFVVSCGTCLIRICVKEVDIVLSSSTPSFLIPGLPVAFVSSDLHVIPPKVIKDGALPSQCQISKMLWPEHIENIKDELQRVKSLGPAAAEEWTKGLEARGKHYVTDASRWENWYLSGGVHDTRTYLSALSAVSNDKMVLEKPAPSSGLYSDLRGQTLLNHALQSQAHINTEQKPTKAQVADLMSQRRHGIEFRASQLQPPIPPSILAHIPSFQEALRVIVPLDDHAWGLLKPRLLAQRKDAEENYRKSITIVDTAAHGLDQTQPRSQYEHDDLKEVLDEGWDKGQLSVQARMTRFADEFIRDVWGQGRKIKRKNCGKFATGLLLYVREKFYAEIAKDAAAGKVSDRQSIGDPTEGPQAQILTLENMKWIFDMKVRPLADCNRQGFFLCSGCTDSQKLYALEAIVQHYAAKHTDVFSRGNVVVCWQSEWPAEPIFRPDSKILSLQSTNSHKTGAAAASEKQAQGVSINPTTVVNNSAVDRNQQEHEIMTQPVQKSSMTHTTEATSSATIGGSEGAVLSPLMPSHHLATDHSVSHSRQGPSGIEGMVGHSFCPHFLAQNKPPAGFRHTPVSHPYRLRIEYMAAIVRDIWKMIGGLKNVPSSVKIISLVHQVVKKYEGRFSEPAPFEMFVDGLSDHKQFSALRKVGGVACKICMSSDNPPKHIRKMLFSDLVSHFHHHCTKLLSEMAEPADWRTEMIWVPDEAPMSGLGKLLSKKKPALRLISNALPWLFKDEEHNDDQATAAQDGEAPVKTEPTQSPKQPSAAISKTPTATATTRDQSHAIHSTDRPNLLPASVVYGNHIGTHQTHYSAGLPYTHKQGPSTERPHGQVNPEHLAWRHPNADTVPVPGNETNPSSQWRGPIFNIDRQNARSPPNYPRYDSRPAMMERGEVIHKADYVRVGNQIPRSRPRSVSPRLIYPMPHTAYRERSPHKPPVTTTYHHNDERHPYSHYQNVQPLGARPLYGGYELIEVRGPQGDYFIKRPVNVRGPETYIETERVRDDPRYSQYTTPYEYRAGHQSSMQQEQARQLVTRPLEYGTYDPRRSGNGGGPNGHPHSGMGPKV